ncbi:MAG: hypothetical protein IKW96_08790 [Ruminococcus sp.]|uniref:hypothetical protein n=1 Tax=Ruminococcus sp. TaxID=41978 RepID=UPI0025DDA12E|nr:hypothetical protein [Ruminococcus sp.]MBR5683352.1 hypothetical protein [Ruminococcus sp.]
MSTFFTVVLIILCAAALVYDICCFISWSRAKEKTFISNILALAGILVLAVGGLFVKNTIHSVLLISLVVLLIPFDITCLSPEGIRTAIFADKGILPVQNLSYEYSKGMFGVEKLDLFINDKKFARGFNLGIKKPKTVKMLADWYGKHGYENPLTK